jgi:hypothetical protein
MEITEKLELNKTIRKYEGTNAFLISLKKSIASKYCKKESVGNKEYKVLSDKQYEAAKGTLGLL